MFNKNLDCMMKRFRATTSLEDFTEHEVLEMLLLVMLPKINAKEVAHNLLKLFGNLKTILTSEIKELHQVESVTVKCAEFLAFLGTVFKRIICKDYHSVQVSDFESLKNYLVSFYWGETVERLCAFSINEAGKINTYQVISVGGYDRVYFDVVKLRHFITHNKVKILLLTHNHPFGSARPSYEDIVLTRELKNILGDGVQIMDHVIVGDDGIESMRLLECFNI